MLLVNNPGSWSHVYRPLEHAEWHGWTPTDLIFPFFLFIVGITTHLSIASSREKGVPVRAVGRKIARRGLLIFAFGLGLNAFPFYTWGTIPGIEDPTLLERVMHRFENLRVPGVLQRIAVVYVVIAIWEVVRCRRASNPIRESEGHARRARGEGDTAFRRAPLPAVGEVALVLALLASYWVILTLLPVPDTGLPGWVALGIPGSTIAAWSDRAVIGSAHLWSATKTWDPEGVLSTLGAVGTGLLGLLAGRWIRSEFSLDVKIRGLMVSGVLLVLLGQAWSELLPINKNLWTSSYVVFTAGAACLLLAACIWLVDFMRVKSWAAPFVILGVNPILAFVGSGLAARGLTSLWKVEWAGRRVPIQRMVYETAFAPWLAPEMASLAYAIVFVGAWMLLLWPLWKKGIYLKV